MTNAYAMLPFVPVMYVDGMEARMPAGMRLSVVRWKVTKEAKARGETQKKPTVAVMLPLVSLSVVPECLASAVTSAIEEMQDAAVRSHVAAALEADSSLPVGQIKIPEGLGTPQGLAMFAAAQAASGRLSKEGLEVWFDGMLQDKLLDLVLTRMDPTTENKEEVAVKQVLKAREAIISLASPRTSLSKLVAIQLQKAVALVVAGDKTREQLWSKLEIFANPPSTEELLLNI